MPKEKQPRETLRIVMKHDRNEKEFLGSAYYACLVSVYAGDEQMDMQAYHLQHEMGRTGLARVALPLRHYRRYKTIRPADYSQDAAIGEIQTILAQHFPETDLLYASICAPSDSRERNRQMRLHPYALTASGEVIQFDKATPQT